MVQNRSKHVSVILLISLFSAVLVFPHATNAGNIPLSDMTQEQMYSKAGETYTGGLYGNGYNTVLPQYPSHHNKIEEAISTIQPINGKILFVTIGMSNVKLESDDFILVSGSDPVVRDDLVIVNGGVSGRTTAHWAGSDITSSPWEIFDKELPLLGLSNSDVQVAWMKSANFATNSDPNSFKYAKDLKASIVGTAFKAKEKFPNLKILFLSNRIYAYGTVLNQEPFAYESGFATQWAILDQINGSLNYTDYPVLAWGPDLWADDGNPRASDGLTWSQSEFDADGIHPNQVGQTKVANILNNFFKDNIYSCSWYRANPSMCGSVIPTATPAAPTATPVLSPVVGDRDDDMDVDVLDNTIVLQGIKVQFDIFDYNQNVSEY